MGKLQPLADRVIIRQQKIEQKKGGILLPDSAKEKPHVGKVISVGPGRTLDNGTKVPVSLAEGDLVYYAAYSGTEIKVEDDALIVLSESDVLAVEK